MFLKNYTSEVPAGQSIAAIEKILIECGVSGITKQYSPVPGEIAALVFQIEIAEVKAAIRLAPDVRACRDALWKDYVGKDKVSADGSQTISPSQKKKKRHEFDEQAKRTAWRICLNEVEIQMSKIQLQQADFREAFLPYLWDGKETVWNRIKNSSSGLLLPEKSS
jgi:hypothetical protein